MICSRDLQVQGIFSTVVWVWPATRGPSLVAQCQLRFLKFCDACGEKGHLARECPTLLDKVLQQQRARAAEGDECGECGEGEPALVPWELVPYTSLQLLDVSVLREYLVHLLRRDAFVGGNPC